MSEHDQVAQNEQAAVAVSIPTTLRFKRLTAAARRRQIELRPDRALVTFRAGDKWLRSELIGLRVELLDEEAGLIFATAEVVAVKVCRFRDISGEDWDRQSDEMIAGETGLTVMRYAYGSDFHADTIVTVVTLDRVKSEHTYMYGTGRE